MKRTVTDFVALLLFILGVVLSFELHHWKWLVYGLLAFAVCAFVADRFIVRGRP